MVYPNLPLFNILCNLLLTYIISHDSYFIMCNNNLILIELFRFAFLLVLIPTQIQMA